MCSVIRLLHQSRLAMDPTLELVGAGPAPCAFILAPLCGTSARNAANRRVARVMQRVVGNLVHVEVRAEALSVPVDDRIDLPDAVPIRPLNSLRIGPRQSLLAADPGDPRVVRRERPLQRLDFPDVTATVGVVLPEVRSFLDRLLCDGDHLRLLEAQSVALDESTARFVRLLEKELSVKFDDGNLESELPEDHVHEHRRLALPGAGEAHAPAELLERAEQRF